MNSSVGVSGFLYHPQSQQVLLARQPEYWSLLEDIASKSSDPISFFQGMAFKAVKVKLDKKDIFSVYDYFDSKKKLNMFILFGCVDKCYPVSNSMYSWFTFKAITKLACSVQTKHDLIIAQRVISAQARSTEDVSLKV